MSRNLFSAFEPSSAEEQWAAGVRWQPLHHDAVPFWPYCVSSLPALLELKDVTPAKGVRSLIRVQQVMPSNYPTLRNWTKHVLLMWQLCVVILTQITWNNLDFFLNTVCLNELILPELGPRAKPCFRGSIKMNVVLKGCTGLVVFIMSSLTGVCDLWKQSEVMLMRPVN